MPKARALADPCCSPIGLLQTYVALNRETKLGELRQLIFVFMGTRAGFSSLPWADAFFTVAAEIAAKAICFALREPKRQIKRRMNASTDESAITAGVALVIKIELGQEHLWQRRT